MHLQYRGISFQHETADVAVTHQPVEASYRGQSLTEIQTQPPRDLTALPFDLSFRGVVYHQSTRPATSPVDLSDLSSLHQHHILERLQRRIQSAQAKGDEMLVQQLEAERRMIAH